MSFPQRAIVLYAQPFTCCYKHCGAVWCCAAGLVEYTVLRSKMLQPGKFEFAVRENKEDGEVVMCTLTDGQGKTNPLQAARNVEMKVDKGQVIAVNLDGDCVIRK